MSNRKREVVNTPPPGRPAEMEKGRRRNVYIDDESWAKAKEAGNGNASEGIRAAIKAMTIAS